MLPKMRLSCEVYLLRRQSVTPICVTLIYMERALHPINRVPQPFVALDRRRDQDSSWQRQYFFRQDLELRREQMTVNAVVYPREVVRVLLFFAGFD